MSSQVEIMAPTMLNAEMLDLDSMLWGGPGVSKCPEKDRDNRHALRKVNTCKYPPIGSIIILPDDVYKSSKIMLPKEGLCP